MGEVRQGEGWGTAPHSAPSSSSSFVVEQPPIMLDAAWDTTTPPTPPPLCLSRILGAVCPQLCRARALSRARSLCLVNLYTAFVVGLTAFKRGTPLQRPTPTSVPMSVGCQSKYKMHTPPTQHAYLIQPLKLLKMLMGVRP